MAFKHNGLWNYQVFFTTASGKRDAMWVTVRRDNNEEIKDAARRKWLAMYGEEISNIDYQ